MKLKYILSSAMLLSPLFISGCDYSHEARLNIENIQQNNTKYIKKYEGNVERFYYKSPENYSLDSYNLSQLQDINFKKINLYTEIYLDNNSFYILDGYMPLKVGDKIYSFKDNISSSLDIEYYKDRNFFCTQDNKCLIDVFLD